jgi:type I restriction enzyme R subunit
MTPPDEEPATPEGEDAIPPTPGEDETIVDQPGLPLPPGDPVRKIYVDGVGARIIAERVEYLDENGKLVTESPARFHQERAQRNASPASTSS